MAQATMMGPPLSPRETRRSGRRSLPSASTSVSKSPDSDPAPKQKDPSHRPPLTTTNSGSGRQKRLKQEDFEEPADERKNPSAPSSTPTAISANHTVAPNGRNKRKPKDKDKQLSVIIVSSTEVVDSPENLLPGAPEEEEQGITRCVCGSTGEDDPDAGEFMVQCETCKVWQHGLCMGFESEDQLHDDDYYCEECKPELHTDLFKKRSKRPRQSSTNSHHNQNSAPSRVSRSHSPSTLLKQPSKRRNTMNSRDAAFDESLKEIIEATAAEAAAHDTASVISTGNRDPQLSPDDDPEPGPNNRKKRKRTEDDTTAKKRTRSSSATPDHQGSNATRDDTPTQSKAPSQAPAPVSKAGGRANKRGGRKNVAVALPLEALAVADGEDVLPQTSARRAGNNGRAKASNAPKRPPVSHSVSHGAGNAVHEHTSRRNQSNGVNGQNLGPSNAESSRAYRNSHAYVVSQQPLYTSWNLPDYLAHLEPMLPTDAPQPLEVRGGAGAATGGGRGENTELTVERGVKVKWPSKRMSVGDMNKRVRSLVEWVGREQATALDRTRRRDALTKALQEELKNERRMSTREPRGVDGEEAEADDCAMMVDGVRTESPVDGPVLDPENSAPNSSTITPYELNDVQSSATMKMMEELMEELIGFQERFGPGARNRERRLVSS